MANAVLQTKIDKAIMADTEIFSNLTLDSIEEARKLAKNSKAKRYSSARELLDDC
jgi:DNA-damage-inducible protein J